MEWIVGLLIIAILGLGLLYHLAMRAPTCTCNQPDCGGGCRMKGRR